MNLVTDRSSSDVSQITSLNSLGFEKMSEEQLEQYLADLKGAYNISDLNRVEDAVAYVLGRYIANGYDANTLVIKDDWTRNDFFTSTDATRYLNNIKYLRNQIRVPEGTPEVPTDMDKFTYSEANDIERILEVVDQCITCIEQSLLYSGELYGGEI